MNSGVIEVRLRELSQLFDAMDPSPFRERDLSPSAEEYIVDSVKELPLRTARELVIYVDQPTGLAADERTAADAIHVHFARRAQLLRRQRRELIRRGVVSLGIGVAFLAAVFTISTFVGRRVGESGWAALFNQGLLIVGWVAMWRPLEIFLYDWWPILSEQRIHDRLSRIKVQFARP